MKTVIGATLESRVEYIAQRRAGIVQTRPSHSRETEELLQAINTKHDQAARFRKLTQSAYLKVVQKGNR